MYFVVLSNDVLEKIEIKRINHIRLYIWLPSYQLSFCFFIAGMSREKLLVIVCHVDVSV